MYKALREKSHFIPLFNLPEDYTVSALLCYGNSDTEKATETLFRVLHSMNISFEHRRLDHFLRNIIELTIEGKIYWFTALYGGAMLSEYVHLACMFGAQKVIHLGSCGGLYPDAKSADLLVSPWSHGDESSTRMYDRGNETHKHFADKELSDSLKLKIDPKFTVWEGPLITCQAMLAETEEDVMQWSKEGYYGVEMETATIFAVSNFFKVPSASLVYVSDNLIVGQVVGDEAHLSQRELRRVSREETYRVALLEILNK